MGTPRSADVSIPADGVRLRGTVTLPADGEGPFPAALLIVGSGDLDRNSDHEKLPLAVTRLLAEALAGVGIGSLRFDKRGVGASGGEYLPTGLHDNIADARSALAVLREHEGIDPDRLLVIGHSEGAFIAAAVGAEERITGLGLLSVAARTGEETLRWQAGAIVPTLPGVVRFILRVFRVDVTVKQRRLFRQLRDSTADVERIGKRDYNARWWRDFLDFDPRPLLARVDVPVLAVTGAKDVQTPPDDVTAVGEAVTGPFEGHVLDDVNHILRHTPGAPSLRHYKRQSAEPLDPRVRDIVTEWARRVTAPTAAPVEDLFRGGDPR